MATAGETVLRKVASVTVALQTKTYGYYAAKTAHYLVGFAIMATGFAFFLFPREVCLELGLVLDSVDGTTEVRAFYGGLEIFLGCFMVFMWDSEKTLEVAGVILFGCSIGRFGGIMLDNTASKLQMGIAMAEGIGSYICWLSHGYLVELKLKDVQSSVNRKQCANPVKLSEFVPFAPENIQNPYPFYNALRNEAPLYKMPDSDFYVLSRYKDIVKAAKASDDLSSNLVAILLSGGTGRKNAILSKPKLDVGPVDVLALADPPVHTYQRKIAFTGLSPKLFLGLKSDIRDIANKMIDNLFKHNVSVLSSNGNEDSGSNSAYVEWMDSFALRLPMIVALDLVGFPNQEHRKVKEWADHGVALLSGVNTPEEFAEHTMESMKLFKWIQNQFGIALEKEKKDEKAYSKHLFLQELIHATKREKGDKKGCLTRKEAESIILQVLLAGNDSSASTMGSAVFELTKRPEMQSFLRENPKRIPDFIEEVLRMESPFGGHFRKVKKEEGIELHGVHLPKGTRIMLLWASGNYDERYWEDPKKFSIERENRRSHLSFGSGIHSCLGQKLARLEVQIVLEILLERTNEIRSAQDSFKPKYVNSTFVRSLEKLPIQFILK